MKATWVSKLDSIAKDQIPFVAAQVANALARDGAEDIRKDFRESVTMRSTTILRNFVRGPSIKATKQKPTARVFVGAPASAKDPARGNLLVQQDEEGTNTKRPVAGNSVMVPTKQYRLESRGKPRPWKVFKRDLGLGVFKKNRRSGAMEEQSLGLGGVISIGRRFRTYLVRAKRGRLAGSLLLFLRTGTGKRNSELLYYGRPQVVIPKRVRSRQQVVKRIQQDSATHFRNEMSKAIASAKAIRSGGGVQSTRLDS